MAELLDLRDSYGFFRNEIWNQPLYDKQGACII